MTRPQIDFVKLNAYLLDNAERVVAEWLPNGVRHGDRWYVGSFDGEAGKSANVCLRGGSAGCWIDNGGGEDERGGDLVSLYARIHNLGNAEAAREIMRNLGWLREDDPALVPVRPPVTASIPAAEGEATPSSAGAGTGERATVGPAPANAASAKGQKWRPVVPVPAHAKRPEKFIWGFREKREGGATVWHELEAVKVWPYEVDGELWGYVARFERINSKGEKVKETLPYTWCEDTEDGRGLCRWHWKQWEDPRPLYLPIGQLSGDISLPVVLVEGEKCAEAGHQLLGHEFDFVTWPGGCKAWAMARWSMLMGRKVYLWPDCDAQRERLTKTEREAGTDPTSKALLPAGKQPGQQAMNRIGAVLVADHGCEVLMCGIPAPGKLNDGWDIADAIEQGWDAERVRKFILAAQPFTPPQDEARAKAAPTPSSAGAGEEEDAKGWRRKLLLTEKDTIKPCRENIVLALDGMDLGGGKWLPGIPEVKGVIAFNEFTNNVMKLKATPWGTAPGPWDETDELELGCWLVREHWLPPASRQMLEEAVSMVARRHRYHPARARFEALRGQWDGQRRLTHWLSQAVRKDAGAGDDSELARYLGLVGAWTMMAIVARVMRPGCKHDYMLILEGPQGYGKSTLARELGGEWFADTGLVLGDKDSYQNLQGVLVYEWGELDSLTRAEVTKVKQFISSPCDRFRASFDRRPKDYPRQVVFVGTTNEAHYLSDPTGNRRMWPVRITQPVNLAWVRDHLEQLFAEALAYVDEGRRFHPTLEEQTKLFEPQQTERQVESALESAIRRYLYEPNQKVSLNGVNGSLVDEITLCDLLTALGILLEKQTHQLTKQAAAVLGKLGWERARSAPRKDTATGEKVRPWVYRRPKDETGGASDPGLWPGASVAWDQQYGHPQGQQPSEAHDACPL